MRIEAPRLEGLTGFETGKIKFFNYQKGFGFITYENLELFVCHHWLCEPVVKIENNVFTVGFQKTLNKFREEQIVLFRPNDNKGKLEAHDVIDSYKYSVVLRELESDYQKGIELFNTLQNYHVEIVRDLVVPKANNETKMYDWIKTGEKSVEIFMGNDLCMLKNILEKEHIRKAIGQPHTRIIFKVWNNDEWLECDDPTFQTA